MLYPMANNYLILFLFKFSYLILIVHVAQFPMRFQSPYSYFPINFYFSDGPAVSMGIMATFMSCIHFERFDFSLVNHSIVEMNISFYFQFLGRCSFYLSIFKVNMIFYLVFNYLLILNIILFV